MAQSLQLDMQTPPFRAAGSRPLDRAKRKFYRLFPGGFRDETYLAWERQYKWEAHREWQESLNLNAFRRALQETQYQQIAASRGAHRVRTKPSILIRKNGP